ncbi:MAG: tetratricopeptide repeat protein [Saprospiraceae bacterium]|nr:tetratricopeptide repeat protein [Saprospiraceae bacterium]
MAQEKNNRFAEIAESWFTWIYRLAIVLVILVAASVLLSDVFSKYYYLDEFTFPSGLSVIGIDKNEYENAILDKINDFYWHARSMKSKSPDLEMMSHPFNIEFSGIDANYGSIVQYLRSKFGLPNLGISGTFFQSDSVYCFRTRVGGELVDELCISYPDSLTVLESIDSVFYWQAMGIMEFLDPYVLSMYFYKKENYKRSLYYCQKALDEEPTARKFALGTMGNNYREMGQLGEAENWYNQSIKEFPEFYPTYWQYADLLIMRGDNEKAKKLLSKVLDNYPPLNTSVYFDFVRIYCAQDSLEKMRNYQQLLIDGGGTKYFEANKDKVPCW